MATKTFDQVDRKTGEVVGGFVAYVAPKRINGFGQEWLAMSQMAAMMLAKSDLSAPDMKVFFALLSKLDFENLLMLSQADLGRELGMQRQHIQRSIKRLIGLNVLLEGPRIGISRSYRLNPQMGWKGSAKNHHAALDARVRAAGLTVINGSKK